MLTNLSRASCLLKHTQDAARLLFDEYHDSYLCNGEQAAITNSLAAHKLLSIGKKRLLYTNNVNALLTPQDKPPALSLTPRAICI